jgi:hypothetical protein
MDIIRIRMALILVRMSRQAFAIGLPRLSCRALRLANAVTPAHLKDTRWPRG